MKNFSIRLRICIDETVHILQTKCSHPLALRVEGLKLVGPYDRPTGLAAKVVRDENWRKLEEFIRILLL